MLTEAKSIHPSLTWPHTSGRWTCEQAPPPALLTPPTSPRSATSPVGRLQDLTWSPFIKPEELLQDQPNVCLRRSSRFKHSRSLRSWFLLQSGSGTQTLVNIKLIYWFYYEFIDWFTVLKYLLCFGRAESPVKQF